MHTAPSTRFGSVTGIILRRMASSARRRAVRDLFAHSPRGDLAHSQVGLELGQHLQHGLTSDVGDGATPTELITAMREQCGDDALAYARLLS